MHSIGLGGAADSPTPACGTVNAETVVAATTQSPTGINCVDGLHGMSDEHTTVLPPGALGRSQTDYLFLVATNTANTPGTGLVVLDGGTGPVNGRWSLSFAPGYSQTQEFLSPVANRRCPLAQQAAPTQDDSFDLNYAAPGSVLVDPTNPANTGPGNLIMVYEGTNLCIGQTGKTNDASGHFYSTIGIATSDDQGRTWPAYRSVDTAFPVPTQDPGSQSKPFTLSPHAGEGETGAGVCTGDNCTSTPGPDYGRYAVVSPAVSIDSAMAAYPPGSPLAANTGDSQPAAFIDDVAPGHSTYLYETSIYTPGPSALGNPSLPGGETFDIVVSRAALTGGNAPLTFEKWHFDPTSARAGSFSQPGNGGAESPIFQPGETGWSGAAVNCEAPTQTRSQPSISYVQSTKQYLLTFLCGASSNPDPTAGGGTAPGGGAALFWSTTADLSREDQWSTPVEVDNSWSALFTNGSKTCGYNGNYPTFMSVAPSGHTVSPGQLLDTGYVFYMDGCTEGAKHNSGGHRQYSVRTFAITTAIPSPPSSLPPPSCKPPPCT
ncbi:MAG: hypothetical protein JO265_03190 [Acidimicrobiia bacterium]|nr:hypothetical protein [Acidimicrobiia bacterium]